MRRKKEILLIHEGDTPYHELWVLPRGYVRPNETGKQTVSREVEEETGLKVESTKLIGIYNDFLTENNEPVNHVISAYKVEVIGGRLIFTKEATAYKWFCLKEALSYKEVPDVFKTILQDYSKERKRRFPLTSRP
ncbi:MAG: NUDIX hydrolase [Candidatus Bathyarchaeota archaeon]|nr:NUDIX hydrolase [Candidatus Bathyarchaeota archaeon]